MKELIKYIKERQGAGQSGRKTLGDKTRARREEGAARRWKVGDVTLPHYKYFVL